MYTVPDVVEIGKAQELILSQIKDFFVFDDAEHMTFWLVWPWPFEDEPES